MPVRPKTFRKISARAELATISDSDAVNLTELAGQLRVSRRTVGRWIADGYEPEFGRRTTVAHAKNWLRTVYAPMIHARWRARREVEEQEQARLLREMAGT
jgi:hypothetical protein